MVVVFSSCCTSWSILTMHPRDEWCTTAIYTKKFTITLQFFSPVFEFLSYFPNLLNFISMFWYIFIYTAMLLFRRYLQLTFCCVICDEIFRRKLVFSSICRLVFRVQEKNHNFSCACYLMIYVVLEWLDMW